MNDLLLISAHFLVLTIVAAVWHSKDERIIRVSLYSGMSVSFLTTSILVLMDMEEFNLLAPIVAFFVYGFGVAIFSSFAAWLIGLPYKLNRI